jgi:hypothetical protein
MHNAIYALNCAVQRKPSLCRPGQDIVVKVDVTANHKVFLKFSVYFIAIVMCWILILFQGFFTFKLCANNDTTQDPMQDCFDK